MKKLLFLLIFSGLMYSQDKDSTFVSAEGSMIFPSGNLKNKFDYATMYGFWFKLGQEKSMSANIGFDILFLKNARAIDYEFNDSIYKINSNNFGLDFGIRAAKNINLFSKISETKFIEIESTFGVHYLDYDFIKENEKEKKNSYEAPFANTTLLLSTGVSFVYKNVGLKIGYRYTPFYDIEGIESKFGSSSFSFGIVYKQ